MKILVTGAAGFIGFHVSLRLMQAGYQVVGIDCLNNYYDVVLKRHRLAGLTAFQQFEFLQLNIADNAEMTQLFKQHHYTRIIHLAAQAGIRYSLQNPHAYAEANLLGFLNILEGARHQEVEHLVFASSSSVYGLNQKLPFAVTDRTDHPVSLYAASKKSNELMAHSYAHLYQIPTTGLRFFTVYGPYGRPDMALFRFTDALLKGEPIDVYNYGKMQRDFTYIDDIVEAIFRVQQQVPAGNNKWTVEAGPSSESTAPYKIYNIGNSQPVPLMDYIRALEAATGRKAIKNFLPLQAGDVLNTSADCSELFAAINFKPETSVDEGVKRFVEWYLDYYQLERN